MIGNVIGWAYWSCQVARDVACWALIGATIMLGGCSSIAGHCDRLLAPEQHEECRAENAKHDLCRCWSHKVDGIWTRWAPCRNVPADDCPTSERGFDL